MSEPMQWETTVALDIRDRILELVASHPHSDLRKLGVMIRPLLELTATERRAVDTYRQQLESDGKKRPAYRLERMVARFADGQIAERAGLISHTVIMTRFSERDRAQYRDIEQRFPDQYEQEWMTAADDRTCNNCDPFHNTRAAVDGMFVSRAGMASKGPPLHDGCRCTTALTLKGFRDTGGHREGMRERILRKLGLRTRPYR